MMKRITCDCCGAEVKRGQIIPAGTVLILKRGLLDDVEYDLCESCAKRIENIIKNGNSNYANGR